MGTISSVLTDVDEVKPLESMLEVAKARKAREQQPQAAAGRRRASTISTLLRGERSPVRLGQEGWCPLLPGLQRAHDIGKRRIYLRNIPGIN